MNPKTEYYRTYLKIYAKMIMDAADSGDYVQRLAEGTNLPPFDQALRNHIEQFKGEK